MSGSCAWFGVRKKAMPEASGGKTFLRRWQVACSVTSAPLPLDRLRLTLAPWLALRSLPTNTTTHIVRTAEKILSNRISAEAAFDDRGARAARRLRGEHRGRGLRVGDGAEQCGAGQRDRRTDSKIIGSLGDCARSAAECSIRISKGSGKSFGRSFQFWDEQWEGWFPRRCLSRSNPDRSSRARCRPGKTVAQINTLLNTSPLAGTTGVYKNVTWSLAQGGEYTGAHPLRVGSERSRERRPRKTISLPGTDAAADGISPSPRLRRFPRMRARRSSFRLDSIRRIISSPRSARSLSR